MELRPTNYDITWFLDQNDQDKLNLEPPYQRKSVWTARDRKFFLDTIFRNYPSPPIYLHKETDDDGRTIWHVVDGKQRLTAVLLFVQNRFPLGNDTGDERLNGKRWKALSEFPELRRRFWDYTFPIQVLPQVEPEWVQEVFDRLNRSSKNLERQELRHAKFEGWFINFVETQAEENKIWKELRVVTTGRARRMKDIQFISELAMITIRGGVSGFSQDELDEFYGKYDRPEENGVDFDFERFEERFVDCIEFLGAMNGAEPTLSDITRNNMHAYSIWSLLDKANIEQLDASVFAKAVVAFMKKVEEIRVHEDEGEDEDRAKELAGREYLNARNYWNSSRGANTELPQRSARHDALYQELVGDA